MDAEEIETLKKGEVQQITWLMKEHFLPGYVQVLH